MTAKYHGFTIGDKVMRAGMLHCELIWEIPDYMIHHTLAVIVVPSRSQGEVPQDS